MNYRSLQKTTLFHDLTEEETCEALKRLRAGERSYEKGALILHAGDMTDALGLVLSGSVTIERSDIWGNRTILSHADAGQFFAETYAFLPNEPLLVDVVANEACRILFIQVGSLKSPGLSQPAPAWQTKLALNLLTISTRKNLQLSGRSFHTAPKTIRGRVMSYLTSVSLQSHSCRFDIPFDRQQLADYLNLDRTALSKELGRMQKEGLLRVRKNHFELPDSLSASI